MKKQVSRGEVEGPSTLLPSLRDEHPYPPMRVLSLHTTPHYTTHRPFSTLLYSTLLYSLCPLFFLPPFPPSLPPSSLFCEDLDSVDCITLGSSPIIELTCPIALTPSGGLCSVGAEISILLILKLQCGTLPH